MVSRETVAVGVSGGIGTALMVGVDLTIGFGEWLGLASFLYLGLFWYALPQLALAVVGGDGLSALRVRLIPVILFLLAVALSLSPLAGGRELLAIWAVVGVAVAALFGSAFVRGYREATRTDEEPSE